MCTVLLCVHLHAAQTTYKQIMKITGMDTAVCTNPLKNDFGTLYQSIVIINTNLSLHQNCGDVFLGSKFQRHISLSESPASSKSPFVFKSLV